MKYRKTGKWDDPAKRPALLYFAQILEEMLFDFSLDTYKPSVMNTRLLCWEAIQTIKEIETGNIRAPNINHVAAELCANFEKDSVAKSLVPLPFSAFVPTLKNPKTPLKELQNVLELLAVQMKPSLYRSRNEKLLMEEIVGRQSLSEIRRLSRSYITTLISMGFEQEHLLDKTLDFFYFGKDRITGPESVEKFFTLFPSEKTEFTVIFRVDAVFEHAAKAFAQTGLEITKKLPPEINLSGFPSFLPSGNKLYAIASKVKARDVHSARSYAESLLKLSSTLLSLFHHKKNPSWLPECIVYEPVEKKYRKISKPINSMHKCADLIQPVASKRLELFMSEFSLERHSFSKFIRSSQLHSMALSSDSAENQILNLWISLESLVPSETKGNDVSNIEHIVASLIPFLNIDYLGRLLNNLVKDLLRWNSTATRKALRPIPGRKFVDKIAKLLALSEFDAERAALEDSFKDFHLLSDRFSHFRSILLSPTTVLAALDAHKLRLEWQIRRIYRTRNIIVHSGVTPGYTRSLIEHTHDYLDTVLSALSELASETQSISSVGQGFKFIELRYTTLRKGLTQKGLVFQIDNMDSLLFGR